ncbi:MAG: hypothetical protein ACI4O7_08205 [Aristaeellaceae bacterium]
MIRHDVYLNGVGLMSIDPAIHLADVAEKVPKADQETVSLPLADGLRILRDRRSSLSVVVTFAILEQDPLRREMVLQAVRTWAGKGGILTLAHKPDRQLRVRPESLPVNVSVSKYTGNLSVTFMACQPPYWESETLRSVTLSGKSGAGTLSVGGDAPGVPVDAAVTPSGTLTALTLRVGDAAVTLRDMRVPAGQTIAFTHETVRGLCIRSGGVSLLSARTPESADGLTAPGGGFAQVAFEADCQVKVRFTARGLWL